VYNIICFILFPNNISANAMEEGTTQIIITTTTITTGQEYHKYKHTHTN
jgi:hypothetical protein